MENVNNSIVPFCSRCQEVALENHDLLRRVNELLAQVQEDREAGLELRQEIEAIRGRAAIVEEDNITITSSFHELERHLEQFLADFDQFQAQYDQTSESLRASTQEFEQLRSENEVIIRGFQAYVRRVRAFEENLADQRQLNNGVDQYDNWLREFERHQKVIVCWEQTVTGISQACTILSLTSGAAGLYYQSLSQIKYGVGFVALAFLAQNVKIVYEPARVIEARTWIRNHPRPAGMNVPAIVVEENDPDIQALNDLMRQRGA